MFTRPEAGTVGDLIPHMTAECERLRAPAAAADGFFLPDED
ncbi:hypothetical protein [Streptomyces yangpuensis]